MTQTRSLAATVHDAVDEVTTAVEGIHKSVAGFPLTVLGEITPLEDAIDALKSAQDQTIEAAYGLVRTINGRVRLLTTGAGKR